MLKSRNSAENGPAVDLSELEALIRLADDNALLTPPRIVRRVIKYDADVAGLGLRVPHRKSYVIEREKLLQIVDLDELDVASDAELPAEVILLARPSADALAEMSRDEALAKYWRLLFHARVHVAMSREIASGRLGEAEVRKRIRDVGESEFQEIRSVLRQEEFLLPPRDDLSTYVEFAAVYLELSYFAPGFLSSYFPSLEDHQAVTNVLKQDVDGDSILSATRLQGCPEPNAQPDLGAGRLGLDALREPAPPRPSRLPARLRSDNTARRWLARADRVSVLGNLVCAAILRTRAARFAKSDMAQAAREEAREELSRLAKRLQAALGFSDNETSEWARSLHALIEQSSHGFWTPEARMLYDLQKVCVDHERGVYALDIRGWLFSGGRKPLKRPLPGQRDVLISKHLRSAAHRLPAVRMAHRTRSKLAALLQSATHRAEISLRARFSPPIHKALDSVKLLPKNPPERVARRKLVDEILDRIVERGFLSMSDLRDALSRNNLKLPDLTSARQFFDGDQLLQADKQLAASLDGVYHAGEIYLRLPQRLSSLAFGTPFGRFLTRYVAIPFGGAYLGLEAMQHLANMLLYAFSGGPEVVLSHVWSVIALGILLLGLLYHRRFRDVAWELFARTWRTLRSIFIDLPNWISQLPLVRQVLASRFYRLFKRFVFKPLLISVLVAPLVAMVANLQHTLVSLAVLFVFVNVILNSRIGRNVDEMVTDWTVTTWHRLRIHFFAAIFRWVMDLFNQILETIERLLYTVDEWLRFRAGESPAATATKAVLGSIWFFVSYFIRFCVVLLIEPQVNPIKHFPVVTVSHKILVFQIPTLERALTPALGKGLALTVATPVIFLLPGVFGFLVWELKENWRLYAANRPPNLVPVPIGHHGETVLQFLRPGFRSGTIPKLYAKLRRASRKAYWTQNWKSCAKCLDGLHHVQESLRRFVDRELIELLHESRSWSDRTVATGEIHLGCNRILVELYFPDLAEGSLWLAFEEQLGWLTAGVHERGWSDALSPARRMALSSALAGFYKMAGVDVVREQIERRLDPDARGYELTDRALVVWTNHNRDRMSIPIRDWQLSRPPVNAAIALPGLSAEDRRAWVFAASPISWRRWVLTWEMDQLGGLSKHPVIENLSLLPHESASSLLDPRRNAS